MLKLFLKNMGLFFYLFLLMLFCTAPFVLLNIYYPNVFHQLTTIIAHYSVIFLLFRWGLIASVLLFWPHFIQYRARKYTWHPDKTQFWVSQRWHIMGWMVVLELVVCENLVWPLINGIWR